MKRVVTLDGSSLETIEQAHEALSDALELPPYYGRNLDALWDCLTAWVELPITVGWVDFPESRRRLGADADRLLATFQAAAAKLEGFEVRLADAEMQTLHPSLWGTVEMLRAAYPEGWSAAQRLPLLRALYDHMSDRNLATAMAFVSGVNKTVLLNDIGHAASLSLDDPAVQETVERLRRHGYEAWSAEA